MDKESLNVRSLVWVGRVKSTVNPALLAEAFGKVGPVRKVETGFGGFAFVEYEKEDDADAAVKQMHSQVLPHIGEIACDRSTFKGYMGAIARRDNYWKDRGGTVNIADCVYYVGDKKPQGGKDSSPSSARSARRTRRRRPRSGTRSPSRSYSRSYSKPRRHTRSRSRRRNKSRSTSGRSRRKRSPSAQRPVEKSPEGDLCAKMRAAIAERKEGDERASAQDFGKAGSREATSVERGACGTEVARDLNGDVSQADQLLALCERYVEPGLLNRTDRVAAVRYFESSNALALLLEGADLVRLSASHVASQLKGFPHGFRGSSHKHSLALLEVLSGFIRSANESGKEMDIEVRQSLVVKPDGQRALRKSVVISGEVLFKHEQPIE